MRPFFRSASSATLLGEELVTAVEALDHSVRVLAAGEQTPVTSISIARRTALANRLRRAIIN